MRYAIVSDIHANEAAFRAVLVDASDAGVEKVICLGDVLGYGPEPVASLELLHACVNTCLAGNHDDAVCGRRSFDDFSPVAAAAVKRHRAELSPEAMAFLRSLSYVHEGDGFACTHGDFSDPSAFNYVLEAEDVLPSLGARREPLLFVGHSHEPCLFVVGSSGKPHKLPPTDFMLEPGKRFVVNPGSVGYPRVGNCRSSYCIYDDAERIVEFRSVPFDLEGYRAKMDGAGIDEAPWVAARAAARQKEPLRAPVDFQKKPEPAPASAVPESTAPVPAAPAPAANKPIAVKAAVPPAAPKPAAPPPAVPAPAPTPVGPVPAEPVAQADAPVVAASKPIAVKPPTPAAAAASAAEPTRKSGGFGKWVAMLLLLGGCGWYAYSRFADAYVPFKQETFKLSGGIGSVRVTVQMERDNAKKVMPVQVRVGFWNAANRRLAGSSYVLKETKREWNPKVPKGTERAVLEILRKKGDTRDCAIATVDAN